MSHEPGATPIFKLYRYNPRRRARGREAAEIEVVYPDGTKDLLWMTRKDILKNIAEWGPSDGLQAALKAYQDNQEISPTT